MPLRIITEDQPHSYVFEIWSYGNMCGSLHYDNINDARKFYFRNFNNKDMYLKLFVDGVPINMTERYIKLKITKKEKLQYGILF